ncbi:hypothetical protein IP68_15690 [Blastomonas sp. AAP25]|uniref:FkbM family methyltransferase n=1 Tax=Blastomonas sp. AAP25 TaxID=1523416 RepID=UPI0006B93830|nr:FkbM family methyltransferase [Blastomonas sp. AAP25]KPF73825.1 hypothetical protein IP68_15690 [Blastomonas sp. AAP25]
MAGEDTDATDWSAPSLDTAAALLAQHPEQRERLWDCLVAIEAAIQPHHPINLREFLTGPIANALLQPGELLTRTVGDDLVINFRNTSKIGRDLALARAAVPDHVWEPQTTRSIVSLAAGRSQVLIGGAYIGDHALFAARVLAPGGLCHCFELSDASLDLLRMNIAANGMGNLVVNPQALWSSDGVEIALDGDDSLASPVVATGSARQTFVSRTIDSYAAEAGIDVIDLIVLDIEGGEHEVLRGAAQFLAQPPETAPALICEIHSAYVDWSQGLRHTPLCRLMIEHGYEVFALRDIWSCEPIDSDHVELVDLDSTYLEGPPHGINVLAVKTRDRLCPDTFRLVHGVSPKLLKHRDATLHWPLNTGEPL